MTATQIYPSIAPIAESELLYQSQHFDPQSQPSFQQQQQQQHSYLDPALAQHDLRVFTRGLAQNPSYDTPIAPYPASDSSEGSMDMWGGVMNWVDRQNTSKLFLLISFALWVEACIRGRLERYLRSRTNCSDRTKAIVIPQLPRRPL